MQCLLQITTQKPKAPDIVSRVLLSLDEHRCILSCNPLEVLTFILARENSGLSVSRVITLFQKVCDDGLSNIRVAIPPRALSLITLNPHLSVPNMPLIEVRLEERGTYSVGYLRIERGEEMWIGSRDLTIAPECEGDSTCPVFIVSVSHYDKDPKPRLDQIAGGSVVLGLWEAAMQSINGVDKESFTSSHAILAGMLCARQGASFCQERYRSDAEWAVGACKAQYSAFKNNGFLLSDRLWNPQRFRSGPRICEMQSAANREIATNAARIWPEIMGLSRNEACRVALAVARTIGIELSQVSSYLRPTDPDPTSNHQIMKIEGAAKRLLDLFPPA